MTNFYVTYTLPEGTDRKEYVAALAATGAIDKSREEAGCIRYDFFYPVDSENQVFLLEQWESREHQQAHCQTEHFAALGKLKEKYEAQTQIIVEDQVVSN